MNCNRMKKAAVKRRLIREKNKHGNMFYHVDIVNEIHKEKGTKSYSVPAIFNKY